MNIHSPCQQYPWKRFWVERGESPVLDGPYLFDPDDDYAWAYSSKAVSMEALSSKQGLILLGEAGMGKSHALLDDYKRCQAQVESTNDVLQHLNLNEFGAGDLGRLESVLFDGDHFGEYKDGASLYIFLDSFDECHALIPNLPQWFIARFREYVIDPKRVFLRIACRTSAWPQYLEEELKQIWDTDDIDAYEICPLRRKDVLAAADAQNIESNKFLERIKETEVDSLACRPVTLRLLLSFAQNQDGMPVGKTELYEQGLRVLIEENNESRRYRSPSMAPEKRFVIAAKIAAALFLSNRSALWVGPVHETPAGDISITEITGIEPENIGQWLIDEGAVKEMLAISGLFSGRGPQRFGFAHQSFGEFLAAYYLQARSSDVEQKLRLLRHTENGFIVPALGEIAAWLATMDRGVFEQLIENEPVLLLNVDGSSLGLKDKEKLVLTLFNSVDRKTIFAHDLSGSQLRKLDYSALSTQLRPILEDQQRSIAIRDFSIDLARHCKVHSVVDVLAAIALSTDEGDKLRLSALSTIAEIGGDSIIETLRPLGLMKSSDDFFDSRMRSIAMKLLWPEHITAEEFFRDPLPDSLQSHISSFDIDIHSGDFSSTLKTEHLPAALDWVKRNAGRDRKFYLREDLIDMIMRKAWEQLEEPGILTALNDAAQVLLKNHAPLFHQSGTRREKDDLFENTDKRQKFLMQLLSVMEHSWVNSLAFRGDKLTQSQDIYWLLDQLESGLTGKIRKNVVQLINALLRYDAPVDITNRILDVCGIDAKPANLPLRKALSWLTHPMRLKSKSTQQARQYWMEEREYKKQREAKRKSLSPLPKERVNTALTAVEAGDLEAWPSLAMEMSLETDSTHYSFPRQLHEQPGWHNASDNVRQRILSAALGYLLNATQKENDLLDRSTHTLDELAPALALELLASRSPDSLTMLTEQDWSKWIEVLLTYLFDKSEIRESLYRLACENAPDAFIAGVMKIVDRRILSEHGLYNLRDFDCIWNPILQDKLLDRFDDEKVPLQSQTVILEYVLKHNAPIGVIRGLERMKSNANPDQLKSTAICLISWNAGAVWKEVSRLLEDEVGIGKEVMLGVALDRDSHSQMLNGLYETQTADLYIFLEINFPSQKDITHTECYEPNELDRVQRLRDSLITQLQSFSSKEAVIQLDRLTGLFPEKDWLKWAAHQARKKALDATWVPPEVPELWKLLTDPMARQISTDDDLMTAMLSSLGRLQDDLHGSPYMASFLWNEHDKRQKGESRLSDFVKYHLNNDLGKRGIIINREVEVRNLKDIGVGERFDLLIQAAVAHQSQVLSENVVSVVIEVKRCINNGLWTDIETQLKDNYLDGRERRCGIYLVGWYGEDHSCRGGKIKFSDLIEKLTERAEIISEPSKQIKAFALDLSLGDFDDED